MINKYRTSLKAAVIVFLLLNTITIFSQKYVGEKAEQIVKMAQSVSINTNRNSIDFVVFDKSLIIPENEIKQWLKSNVLKALTNDDFELYKIEKDNLNYTHYRYRQTYNGLPVEDGVYYIHIKNGEVKSINGEYYSGITINTTPSLSKEAAFKEAIKFVAAKKYIWELDWNYSRQATIDSCKLVVIKIKTTFRLAYKMEVYAAEPLSRQFIFVDANTGEIIHTKNRIHAITANGIAHTAYSGIQNIKTDSITINEFRLRDLGRNIETNDSTTSQLFMDTDNVWNNTSNKDNYATDAHWGAAIFYDYFFSQFGRNSLDGLGMKIKSNIHVGYLGGGSMTNAYWTGSSAIFGDGDGFNYSPLTSLDIVVHEFMHGLTEFSAGLVYANESGALNESFSDIFGNGLRFKYAPSVASWFFGNQFVVANGKGKPFRNMANPNQFESPDTYGGLYFNFGDKVHYNSGIQNFWFYLLCEGGTGINDLNQKYRVAKINMDDALAIAYRNLTVYLTPNSNFQDAFMFSKQATTDLFGTCSNQYVQVCEAWYAVGVNPQSSSVFADFTINSDYSCTAPAFGTFMNNSVNVQSYIWDYGDGETGTFGFHLYNTPGIYNVKLVVQGTGSCGTTKDSVTKIGAIIIGNKKPIAKIYFDSLPAIGQNISFVDSSTYIDNTATAYIDFGDGNTITTQNTSSWNHTYSNKGTYDIFFVVTNCYSADTIKRKITVDSYRMCLNNSSSSFIGKLYDSGGKNNNYSKTENCTFLINPPCADTIFLELQLSPNRYTSILNPVTINLYDGTNKNAPIIASIKEGMPKTLYKASSGSIFISFSSNYYAAVDSGFVATWSSITSAKKPKVDFSYQPVSTSTSILEYNFSDISEGGADDFKWYFGDGATSNLQSPTHTYTLPGTYQVKLIATNCNGTDSTTKSIVIHAPKISCTGNNISSEQSGILYDTGGLNGNYSDNENCTFYIYPEPCNTALDLFYEHDLAYGDTLYILKTMSIYNSYTNNYQPIATLTGKSIGVYQYNNGSSLDTIKIIFKSNSASTSLGYSIRWNYTIPSFVPNASPITYVQTYFNPKAFNFYVPGATFNQTTNVNWDFGDGNSETTKGISAYHVYANFGVYTVKAVAVNCIGQDSSQIVLNTFPTGVRNLTKENYYLVYPNPSNNNISIKGIDNKKFQLRIINNVGQIIQQNEYTGVAENIDVSVFPTGLYFFQINDSERLTNLKVQIIH